MKYAIISKDADYLESFLTEDAIAIINEASTVCLAAIDGEKCVGVLAMSIKGKGRVTIESIVISPKYQRKGVGTGLLEYAEKLLKDNNITTIYTQVFGEEEDLQGYSSFLSENEFMLIDELPNYQFTLKQAAESAIWKRLSGKKMPKEIQRLSEVSARSAVAFSKKLEQTEMYRDFISDDVLDEHSFCYVKDKEIQACLLMGQENGYITVEYMYVSKSCKNAYAMLYLMLASLKSLVKEYPANSEVSLAVVNATAKKIVKTVIDSKMKKSIYKRYMYVSA